jgi:DNA-binding transcriptional MerR regulator
MQMVSIGAAARASGVAVPTIRYYESIGLLRPPPRAPNGRRLYDRTRIDQLAFIRHGRAMDFDLEDIRTLLILRETPGRSCGPADAIARARLADVDERLSKLTALKLELSRMIDSCSNDDVATCRVLGALA